MQYQVPSNNFTQTEMQEVGVAINKLIHLGAVSKCKPVNDQYLSKFFLAPKPNGNKRFILNLKEFNKFIAKSHFKMEDHRTAAKLIPKDGYLATIDLKEAYLLIPVKYEDRKYLRFQFQSNPNSNDSTTFEFTAMPYGLSVAPWVFTKIMREVISFLRRQNFKSVIYLDDILCIGDTFDECRNNVLETLRLLQSLGFVVNFEKSNLQPQKVCRFLGFMFDTESMTISLPDDKRDNIAQLVKKFSKISTCSMREYAQLIGVLVAACPAIKYGWVYTKILERQKYLALLKNSDYDEKIMLPKVILYDLNWWSTNVKNSFNEMRYPHFKLEIYTDASNTGWGAICGDKRTHGAWKEDENTHHINYKELLAILLGLKVFAKHETNCALLLRVDNTTAVSYVNRMGGIQFPHLNNLSRQIWQWCEKRNIWIYASYVNTKDNQADAESRIINPDTEWELSNQAFETIIERLGSPNVDLFASRTNAKCPCFASWKQDPDATYIDAFTIDWRNINFYAFPPFSLILKCLRKIVDDNANGILVFPYWPSQPWYPLLKNLLASEIVYFTPNNNILKSPFRSLHPLHATLTLAAARLCSKPSAGKIHHQTQ